MRGIVKSACAALCLAAALSAPAARADVAPPDVTCETRGAACDNAAPNGFGAGVCTDGVPTTAFGRPSCGPVGNAGATSCLYCQAAGGSGGAEDNGGIGGSGTTVPNGGAVNVAGAAGGAGAPAAGASSSAGAGTKPTSGDDSKDDGGCSVRQLGSERNVAVFMVAIGVAALALGRRRR